MSSSLLHGVRAHGYQGHFTAKEGPAADAASSKPAQNPAARADAPHCPPSRGSRSLYITEFSTMHAAPNGDTESAAYLPPGVAAGVMAVTETSTCSTEAQGASDEDPFEVDRSEEEAEGEEELEMELDGLGAAAHGSGGFDWAGTEAGERPHVSLGLLGEDRSEEDGLSRRSKKARTAAGGLPAALGRGQRGGAARAATVARQMAKEATQAAAAVDKAGERAAQAAAKAAEATAAQAAKEAAQADAQAQLLADVEQLRGLCLPLLGADDEARAAALVVLLPPGRLKLALLSLGVEKSVAQEKTHATLRTDAGLVRATVADHTLVYARRLLTWWAVLLPTDAAAPVALPSAVLTTAAFGMLSLVKLLALAKLHALTHLGAAQHVRVPAQTRPKLLAWLTTGAEKYVPKPPKANGVADGEGAPETEEEACVAVLAGSARPAPATLGIGDGVAAAARVAKPKESRGGRKHVIRRQQSLVDHCHDYNMLGGPYRSAVVLLAAKAAARDVLLLARAGSSTPRTGKHVEEFARQAPRGSAAQAAAAAPAPRQVSLGDAI
ncbi:hypothetical protein T492DRAFT_857935 [Pavlovales sp. CCMP2436]|nr:hypothetical protein T492DRAFT_857935 [Pavlovales sp. CCMP2436]